MKFKKLNSAREVNVNVSKYLIDWDHAVSKPQKAVKDFLYPFWKGHIVLEEFRIPGSLLRIDLLNLTRRIAIEVSPSSSHSFNKFFHKDRFRFGRAVGRDLQKRPWCEQNDIQLIEIFDTDIPLLSRKWFKDVGEIEL
jgi:hypothetical protein